jgi:hypothetical protein
VILADTSAWVEYLRATGSPAHLRLRELIAGEGELLLADGAHPVRAGDPDHARHQPRRYGLAGFAFPVLPRVGEPGYNRHDALR